MERIFFFGGNTVESHRIAERLGFRRGQYVVVIGYESTCIRGLRGETMYVVGNAANRDDYDAVINDALMRDFTIIYIDDETLGVINSKV